MAEAQKLRITDEGVYQSGITGITWEKNIDTWRAAITVEKESRILGFSPNLNELIPLMAKGRERLAESVEAFNIWYDEVIGRQKRVCTPSPLQSDVAGVSFNARSGKWTVAISVENRKYVLATFPVDEQENAESLRKEADKIKEKCEKTPTENGIIDYSEVFNFLEELRIERQQSRLDARIGTGHGRKAWRRLKREEHALDKLTLKRMSGELRKELRQLDKSKKTDTDVRLENFPTIHHSFSQYYVFVKRANEENGKEYYVGKSHDLFTAILLHELASTKINSDMWVEWYETYLDMGLKSLTIDEIANELGISLERYKELHNRLWGISGMYYGKEKQSIGTNTEVVFIDRRMVAANKPISDKDRIPFEGVTYVTLDGGRFPVKGSTVKVPAGVPIQLFDNVVDDLFDANEIVEHIEAGDFYTWYIFESGLFD